MAEGRETVGGVSPASVLPGRAVPTGLAGCLPGADGQTLGELCAGAPAPSPSD